MVQAVSSLAPCQSNTKLLRSLQLPHQEPRPVATIPNKASLLAAHTARIMNTAAERCPS